MFQIIRKYALVMLIFMMSLFSVALVMAKYNDSQRFSQNLRMENCVELEMEDYEWDEFAALDSVKPFLVSIRNPLLLVLLGAIITIIQSSSVMTSIAITMAVTGLISLARTPNVLPTTSSMSPKPSGIYNNPFNITI